MRRFYLKFMGLDVDGVRYGDGSVHMHAKEQGTFFDMAFSADIFKTLMDADAISIKWID
jgi:hypothetical protein